MGKASTITDQIWYEAWVKNGYNATEAYLSLRPDVKRQSAADSGNDRHAKFKKSESYKHLEDLLAKNIDELLKSEDDKIKLSMTKDILDRSKGRAKESIEHSGEIKVSPILGGISNVQSNNSNEKDLSANKED